MITVTIETDASRNVDKTLLEVKYANYSLQQELKKIREEIRRGIILNTSLLMGTNIDLLGKQKIETIDCLFDSTSEQHCKTEMYRPIQKIVELLQRSDLEGAINELRKTIDYAETQKQSNEEKRQEDPRRNHCLTHWDGLLSVLQNQLATLQSLTSLEPKSFVSQTKEGSSLDISKINPKHLHENVLKPISNPTRLQILLEVYRGRKRFSDYEEIVKLEGGHLLYHLKPLIKNGLIFQDRDRNYLLTEKGRKLLETLAVMNKLAVSD